MGLKVHLGGLSMGGGRKELILGGVFPLKRPKMTPQNPPRTTPPYTFIMAWHKDPGGGQWERRGLMGLKVHLGGGGVFQWEVEGRG